VPPDLPPVFTDRAQLESAVLNLAVNARDAMPSGGQIAISALQATSADGEAGVLLTVRDDGEGMDAATLMRAAEPFFTTKGVGKGTGLGLSMVHGLAQQSGGNFSLESSPGKGTTAKLWLPLGGGGVPNLAAMEQPETSAYSPKQVLVVDDDALVLLNTVTLAEELGHTVIEASSAAEALAILRERPVDLVITDYAMPRMNGGQLAQAIVESWPDVKVIIATGYSEMPEELKGRFERLGKPFWSRDLKGAIERTFKWRLEPT
jgi:CheY-like chemotaxis protein